METRPSEGAEEAAERTRASTAANEEKRLSTRGAKMNSFCVRTGQ
jgi:hypothetical protein